MTTAMRPPMPEVRVLADPEIIIDTRHTLRDKLNDAIARGARRIEVDFSVCRHLDSSGMGVLVGARKRAHDAGAALVLTNVSDALRDQFEVTRLDTLFAITWTGGAP